MHSCFADAFQLCGCITVDPYWDHEFDGVGEIKGDAIRIVQDSKREPSVHWIAFRTFDLEEWFLIRFEGPKGKYDTVATTKSNKLQAWFMKTPLCDPKARSEYWHDSTFDISLPEETFEAFRNAPSHELFRHNVVKLDGRMRIRGEGTTVDRIDIDLMSQQNPNIRFKGSVMRRWHLFRVNFILI